MKGKIKQNVAVDIGNSQIKSGLFEGEAFLEHFVCRDLDQLAAHYTPNLPMIFSSVREYEQEIKLLFNEAQILTYRTHLPISIDYKTPETLGVDRIAAMVGASVRFPSQQVLVIDAGSCITYDYLDSSSIYQGGVIAPGLKMRMRAMAQQTKRLPDISEGWQELSENMVGKTTRECLLNGTLSATTHEMNGFIDSFLKEYGDMRVILTGGDARHFESKLKAPIFADFDLVLVGLNRILIHNQ